MKENIDLAIKRDDEIDLIEVITKIIDSKRVIIVTVLFFTILTFLYSQFRQPIFNSSVIIEIGHYELNDGNGTIELIDKPENIVQELNINVKLKNGDDFSSTKIDILEERLIRIQHSSKSIEKNINILGQFTNYLDIKHASVSKNRYLEKKRILSKKIEQINSDIELQKNYEKLIISTQIKNIENELSYIENQISNLQSIIIEDGENLSILKASPELYLESITENPTLNQVIFSYNEKLDDFYLKRQLAENEKSSLVEQLILTDNNQLPTDKLFSLSKMKNEFEIELNNLEDKILHKITEPIGEIETIKEGSNNIVIALGSLLAGLIASFLLIWLDGFKKAYRERKT